MAKAFSLQCELRDSVSHANKSRQVSPEVAKFEVTGNQVILYLRELSGATPLKFTYSLLAKYPRRVQTPASSVDEYYQPQNRAQSKPVELEVAGLP